MGALQATGAVPSNLVSAGVYNGFHATIAAATTILCAGTSTSMSMTDYTFVGASQPFARILSKPSADQFQFQVDSSTSMELNSNGGDVPGWR